MNSQNFKKRFFGLLLIILLAILWLLWDAQPALAQEKTVNHTYGKLENADFSHQDLPRSVFAAAELSNATFEGANLRGSIFTKAVMVNANLANTDLTGALIDRVVLDHANLTNAILREATASLTHFFDANITGADFTDAIVDRYQASLMCKRATGINPLTGVSTKESLGC
jgi:uncharacterized protein YjbI with pentapeptide repeats